MKYRRAWLSALLIALWTGNAWAADSLASLVAAARAEGRVDSVGMPDCWANWKSTWADMQRLYGLAHADTDMSSAREIATFAAQKDDASADIGDVGAAFGPLAVAQGVTQPYKPTTWAQIPDWAKDKDGNWALAYTGSIAFIIDKHQVKHEPKSWADLLQGKYRVAVGDVNTAAQAESGVLAAAYATGGDETNLTPALQFFAKLAKQGRLSLTDPTVATLEKGAIDVGIVWDFNGLNYRDQIDRKRFDVVIPSDGSVVSGYTTIINKYAKHPNAAKLVREYIFSDAGQANLARGYTRPIRAPYLHLPPAAQAKLLPESEYAHVRPILHQKAWQATLRQLPRLWQKQVLIYMR